MMGEISAVLLGNFRVRACVCVCVCVITWIVCMFNAMRLIRVIGYPAPNNTGISGALASACFSCVIFSAGYEAVMHHDLFVDSVAYKSFVYLPVLYNLFTYVLTYLLP